MPLGVFTQLAHVACIDIALCFLRLLDAPSFHSDDWGDRTTWRYTVKLETAASRRF